MRPTFRLALAAALLALSASVARAEKVSLLCEPDGNEMSSFIVDVDYVRSAVFFTGGITFPARITDKEIAWVHKKEDTVDTYSLNRITGRLTAAWSVAGRVGANFFRCNLAKQRF
jgi:hypothetical protein